MELNLEPQLRSKLEIAFRTPGPTWNRPRPGCPNRARTVAGVLTEVELRHVDNCPWCKELLLDRVAQRSRPKIRYRTLCQPRLLKVAGALSVLLILCSLVLKHKDRKGSPNYQASETSRPVLLDQSTTTTIALAVTPVQVKEPRIPDIAFTFGTKRHSPSAIKQANKTRATIAKVLDREQLVDYDDNTRALALEVGRPCYFRELLSAREQFARRHKSGKGSTLMAEFDSQLERVKEIGAKQELLNLNWTRGKISACAAAANQAKRQKEKVSATHKGAHRRDPTGVPILRQRSPEESTQEAFEQ